MNLNLKFEWLTISFMQTVSQNENMINNLNFDFDFLVAISQT